jgi:hypothetical protein
VPSYFPTALALRGIIMGTRPNGETAGGVAAFGFRLQTTMNSANLETLKR